MAKLRFNKENHIEDFTFIVARRDFYKYGIVKGTGVNYKSNFNAPDELSLQVYKPIDAQDTSVWDRINEYNVLIVPELGDDGFFEIDCDLNEDEKGVYKSITATSLAESELSHTKIYNYEVNTEAEQINDKEWSADYHTVLYRDLEPYVSDPDMYAKMKHVSLLHRVLDKLPNYTIAHVDSTLLQITDWYQFSWDNIDVYSVLVNEIASQYHVLFKFNSRLRTISVYDLYSVCYNDNCSYRVKMLSDRNITTRYRGDFQRQCPYCGSTNITPGYGKFTNIYVSKDNLTTSASVRSNKDSLLNSFKIKSGDDLMDAAVANQNPNGSNYIYQFSEENKHEMPPNLVTALENYSNEYDLYYNGDASSGKGIYTFTNQDVTQYNKLITDITGKFTEDTLKNFINLKRTYVGYQSLASQYYSVMDLKAFYEYSMSPDVQTNHDSLDDTKTLLETEGNLSPVAVIDPVNTTTEIIENGIEQSANCIINTALYELTINTTSWTKPANASGTGTWIGTITITSIEHKGTLEESENTVTTNPLTITVNNNMALYVKQKVDKLISRKNAQVKPLTDVIDLNPLVSLTDYSAAVDSETARAEFRNQLKYYSYDILVNIVDPCFQDVMSIIQENSNKINSLYYDIYQTRLRYIQNEIVTRKQQINIIKIILKKIDNYRDRTKKALNFQDYLGTDLYNLFCSYRREDTYQNSNYISDNLDNTEIMKRAGDLIDYAQKELFKASNLQYEVTGSLNNLLALPSFSSIFDDFEVGNWIHMSVDDKIYNLRLLSYQVNFDDMQNIDVEFSTVEKLWNGASDIQAVLKAAGSIAGSYSNTQSQVKHFSSSDNYVRNWVQMGLDATQTKFMDDPVTQEIVYDSSGLYARGFDEITSTYYPQQLKINKNGLYLTEDNWESMSTGVGAFTYYDPELKKYIDSYGVIAKTLVGKLILGENLKIVNSNALFKINDDGLTLTNNKNTFTVNPNNNTKLLALSNSTQDLLWVDSNGVLHIRGDGSGLDISSNAKFGDYSTTTEMNSAISTSAQGLTATFNRTLTNYSTTEQMNSAISVSAEAITTTVSNTYETKTDANTKKESLQSEISQTADRITQTVSDNYTELNGKITTNANNISTVTQTASEINSTVSSHTTSINTLTGKVTTNTENISKIDQKADNITLSVSKIVDGEEVSAAKIVQLVNDAGSSVTISADHINLTAQNIANKINNSSVTISADRIDLSGVTTITNSGIKDTQIIYRATSSKSSAPTIPSAWINGTGDGTTAWTLKRPSHNLDYPYVYTAIQTKTNGDSINCTTPVLDDASTKNDTIAETQRIYKSISASGSAPGMTTTWVKSTSNSQNTWTTHRPQFDPDYPNLYTAIQAKTVDGTVSCTTPILDDTLTVIDGGHITTGYIKSLNYNGTNNGTNNTVGSIFDLSNGNFNFGGGSIVYNASTKKLTFGSNVTLTFDNLPSTVAKSGDIPTDVSDLTDTNGKILTEARVTTITENTVDTTYVNALGITADYINANTAKIGLFSIDSNGLKYGSYVKISPGVIYLSTNGNSISESIYMIPGSGKNYILISGSVNSMGIGYFENISNVIGTRLINRDVNTLPAEWGMYCTDHIMIMSEKKIAIYAGNNNDTGQGYSFVLSNTMSSVELGFSNSAFRPSETNDVSLGSSSYKWTAVYAQDSSIQTSDRKDKDILGNIDYAHDFIMALEPKTFMWKTGDHRRTRMGFIAQDVAKVCKNLNQNLSVVTASYKIDYEKGENDPNYTKDYFGEDVDDSKLTWGMSYEQLIAPMVTVIQEQQKQIESLQNEVTLLKQYINE